MFRQHETQSDLGDDEGALQARAPLSKPNVALFIGRARSVRVARSAGSKLHVKVAAHEQAKANTIVDGAIEI